MGRTDTKNQLITSTNQIRRDQIASGIFVVSGIAVGLWLLATDLLWQNLTTPVLILITGILLSEQASSLKRILRLRTQILSLAEAAGTSPLGNVPGPVLDALRQGDRAQAEKLYREATGAGHYESREIVDDLIYYRRHTRPKQP